MKSIADCRVIFAGVLALNGLVPSAGAKTIVVNSYDAAAVFVSPGRHFADLTLPGWHPGAQLPVGAPAGAAWSPGHGSNSIPVHASFASPSAISGLYEEARRFALNGGNALRPALGNGASVAAPVKQSDFWAMLLVGALLIAHQLRCKHRSLKQSLIAG
jgi:hypothetical protein